MINFSIDKLKHTNSNNFFLMAGPCAIESEDMALSIAEKIVTFNDYSLIKGNVTINNFKCG